MNLWFRDSIIYHIYPFGFFNAPEHNSFEQVGINRFNMIDDKWIAHFKEIGVNAIYFSPIFESTSHGYDTVDYYHIDNRLGSDEDFKELVERLHKNNIKVILDGVFNHVGRDFWAFKDLLKNGRKSKFVSWFKGIDFEAKSVYGDSFAYCGWEGHFNLVELNLQEYEVREHIFGAIREWITQYGIDGIRFDVAYSLPSDFLRDISKVCRDIKEDILLLGEMIHGDYRTIANDEMLHSATNYECYKGLYSSHNDKNYFEIAYSLNRLFGEKGIYKDICLYNFADNHDVNRVASTLKDSGHLFTLYALLFTMPGVPSIYYGSEWGIEGIKENGSDNGIRPYFDINHASNNFKNRDLCNAIKNFARIRLESLAIKYGSYKELLVKNEQLVFMREYGSEKIIVALNLAKDKVFIKFCINAPAQKVVDLLCGEEYAINNNELEVSVPPCWVRILKV